MPTPTDLSSVLAQLRERYLASSGNTIAAFTRLAEQLQQSPSAPEVVEALRRELHRVHGTAGSYGFHEASRLAGALEPVAVQWTKQADLDRDRRAAIVRQFVRALAAALRPADDASTDAATTPASHAPADTAAGPNAPRTSGADPLPVHHLLLVDVPDAAATALVAEAIHRGYHVERVTATGVAAVFEATPPTIVVAGAHVDLHVPDGIPLLLLRGTQAPAPTRRPDARILEASTDAREILQMAELLASRTGLVGVTLLLVEDDPAMTDLLRTMCERQGMFVETRVDAQDILTSLAEVRPALLLLDIGLPGINGLEVTRQLRTHPNYRELPIVLVSAATDTETRTQAFRAGADDFQSKPVVAEELLRRIERLLEAARQQQLARGIHPGTGLLMPARAQRAFDESLARAAAAVEPATLAVLRPFDPPDGVARTAVWHRDLRLLAAALGAEGVQGGFRDETAGMFLFPMDGAAVQARLEPFAEASRMDLVPWSAGVVELAPGAEPSVQRMMQLADEAWLAARDHRAMVRVWNPSDADAAPDVVVVEDDASLSDLLTFALSSRGLTWQRFGSGPGALEALRGMRTGGRAPIVLLDVDLPGLDGFSLFERLRVERPGVFRVVFMSVHASEADQLRAIRAGALDYLAKPLSLRVLLAKIATWRASEERA